MADDQKPRRRRGLALLVVVAVALIVLMTASLLGSLPPSGARIVDGELPPEHHTEACFDCHRGIPNAADIDGEEAPEGHPLHECANCHEGYVPSSTPDLPQPGANPNDTSPEG